MLSISHLLFNIFDIVVGGDVGIKCSLPLLPILFSAWPTGRLSGVSIAGYSILITVGTRSTRRIVVAAISIFRLHRIYNRIVVNRDVSLWWSDVIIMFTVACPTGTLLLEVSVFCRYL